MLGRGVGRLLAGGLAALLFGTAVVASGTGLVPASAMEGASLLVVKTVDGQEAKRDLRPGDSVVYRVEFRVNDEDADSPVRVVDRLPEEFAGWQISELTAVVGGSPTGVTLDLPGVVSGPSTAVPASGTLGTTPEDLTITVGVALPVQAGTGNDSGLGMSTRHTGVLEYILTVPSDLSPSDPVLRTDLVNTATFSAMAGLTPLSVSDTAIISVDNPLSADVTPAKSWVPNAQTFQPGAASTVTIGGTQSSNVAASTLRLQDPADAALAVDGATVLPAGNPFNYVDFAGFTGDPTTNLPTGATAATVEVYHFDGASWNWTDWSSAMANSSIAGVRIAYTGTIPPGATVSQSFSVEQRATNRATGESVSAGYSASNAVAATVEVPGLPPVSKQAEAVFTVGPERIDVTAQKRFHPVDAPEAETANLTGVTAGDTVGVVLRAINEAAPQSTTLDRLVIVEPGAGSDPRFFSADLSFAGFDNADPSSVWPAGATAAQLTWAHPGGPTTVNLNPGDPLPAAPAGVTGFELAFTGAIAPGATSEIRYALATSPDEAFVGPGATAGPFRNTIDVTGQKQNLDDDTANAGANLSLVAPRIDVTLDKRVGPGVVLPGQNVVVQLDTEVSTAGGRTQPTEIVVEDAYSGPGTFWDAFDATQILPPITRPVNGASQADLTIFLRDAAGDWTAFATNPDADTAIPLPAGTTGVRYVYTNAAGFAQTTYVKPNLSFTARAELRSAPGTSTAGTFDAPELYENVATAAATGTLDTRVVTGGDEDAENVGIRGTGEGTGPGPGGLWTDKAWAHDSLTSQSGATTWTTQYWAVTQGGYATVQLQDPAVPTADGAGTVFEAFDLTHIRPIRFAAGGSENTVDAMLRWDVVTDVQLWDGADWTSVTAPAGGWMDANGFTGHVLTEAQRQSTIGVRLVLAENTEARQAAADAGDLTAPAVGAGVASSAEIRSYRLDWQLRETARPVGDPVKWVKETGTTFNCGTSTGCIDNVFGLTATPEGGSPVTDTADDTIQLIDGTTNVSLAKQVRPLPLSGSALPGDSMRMVAPNEGELDQADYPRARYTLTARNASTMPSDSDRGAMRLGKIRVTDTSTHQLSPAPAFDIDGSAFAGRSFSHEVEGSEGNHFDEFTLTGVSFEGLPDYIDATESTVELWLYDGSDPLGMTETFTLQQAQSGDAAFLAALPNAIGIAVTYSGTDPVQNGNRIRVGDDLVVHLDVQLRATTRLSGDVVEGGSLGSSVSVPNEATAHGWDAVVNPGNAPEHRDDAAIELESARVLVNLQKQVAVDHGGGATDQTILEAQPNAPVNVLLTADPAGATAPLNALRIEDDSASFWERFRLVSFGSPTLPTDADTADLEVLVAGDWVRFADYTGDLADIRGVAVDFSRAAGNGLFPAGATSWNSSWGSATLPFTVQLRDDAVVEWGDDQEQNTAFVFATNDEFGTAEDDADAEVDFDAGTNAIRVVKRAPNDTGSHQVDPLASLPWHLEFTNTGTSYLPIERVTDAMPASLSWDGEEPVFASTPGTSGLSGLSADAADVTVTLSPDGRDLVFEWPAGSRMEPGETMRITLGLILQPLPTGERATNSVSVETGVPLALCTQPNDFGQRPEAPTADDECSNTNYVQPRVGTVIGAVKTVNGEPAETLGEHLVTGALDVRNGLECAPGNHLPVGSDFTRNPCASYTAVGSTDVWKLEHINSGTNALSSMTIVDMMPHVGDQMLAGGAPRGSTFRPVLSIPTGGDLFAMSGLPAGATYTIDVTANADACVGPDAGTSLWVADPECVDAAANPANAFWTPLDDFLATGDVADIAGFRIRIDMSAEPLQPAGNVVVQFETVNRVIEHHEEGLQPNLAQFETPQFAWNQNGVIAWDTAGNRVNLPAAPQRAGVTIKTADLVISKEVLGDGAQNAPDSFEVELSCTVPSGVADPERVPLDLGDRAIVTVPKDESVTLSGLPIGTDCIARESGETGAYGESGRSILDSSGVTPDTDGLSAEVKIREAAGGETLLQLRNTYTLGELVVEKIVRSGNGHELSSEQRELVFEFELVCRANGLADPVTRGFELRAGEQHREADLPEGANCELTETSTRGALATSIAVGGEESDGASRGEIVIVDEGGHVLVTNTFDGPVPPLENTGATNVAGLVGGAALLLLLAGVAAVLVSRRRSKADGRV